VVPVLQQMSIDRHVVVSKHIKTRAWKHIGQLRLRGRTTQLDPRERSAWPVFDLVALAFEPRHHRLSRVVIVQWITSMKLAREKIENTHVLVPFGEVEAEFKRARQVVHFAMFSRRRRGWASSAVMPSIGKRGSLKQSEQSSSWRVSSANSFSSLKIDGRAGGLSWQSPSPCAKLLRDARQPH